MSRSTKYYRKNEKEVMRWLGFEPTVNSGAGWISKEDGESETHMCQLKSTDKMSITVNQNDLHILENHAAVSHKEPVFAIQFLNTGETWLMIRESEYEYYMELLEYVKTICDVSADIEEMIEEKQVDKLFKKNYNGDKAKQSIASRNKINEQRQKEKEEQNNEYEKRRKEREREWRKSLAKKG